MNGVEVGVSGGDGDRVGGVERGEEERSDGLSAKQTVAVVKIQIFGIWQHGNNTQLI